MLIQTRSARAYTALRTLPLPRPKRASQILSDAADRADAAGDIVMAYKLREQARQAMIEELRQ